MCSFVSKIERVETNRLEKQNFLSIHHLDATIGLTWYAEQYSRPRPSTEHIWYSMMRQIIFRLLSSHVILLCINWMNSPVIRILCESEFNKTRNETDSVYLLTICISAHMFQG